MCIAAGQTGLEFMPAFATTAGVTVTDGGVIWVSLGTGGPSIEMPIGGTIGNVVARSYFPTDRGRRSIEYLLMLARAKLVTKARAVEVTVEVPFRRALSFSCRKSATILDDRLPGGQATGKIVKYSLSGDGASGKFTGSVTIGCAVGNGGSQTGDLGAPAYVDDYVVPGYQTYTGSTILVGTDDITYAPPLDDPNDDGLTFPLTPDQVILHSSVEGSIETQSAAIASSDPRGIPQSGAQGSLARVALAARNAGSLSQSIEAALARPGNSIYVDLLVRPVTGNSFTTVYGLDVGDLKVAKQIDLEVP